jgi:hypothetical protein
VHGYNKNSGNIGASNSKQNRYSMQPIKYINIGDIPKGTEKPLKQRL